jgi:hypothetical protein
MKRILFAFMVIAALGLTFTGVEALVQQVVAADSLKSSVITFIVTLGYALLGPACLAAAFFFRRRSDSRARSGERVPATPKPIYHPYLHEH